MNWNHRYSGKSVYKLHKFVRKSVIKLHKVVRKMGWRCKMIIMCKRCRYKDDIDEFFECSLCKILICPECCEIYETDENERICYDCEMNK